MESWRAAAPRGSFGRRLLAALSFLSLLLLSGWPRPLLAQRAGDLGASVHDGGAFVATAPDAADAGPASPSPDRALADAVRALCAGNLAVTISPSTLFDVPLSDEAAVRAAALRTRAFLQLVDASASSLTGPPSDAGANPDAVATMQSEAWAARVDLDRARLAFYELPAAKRTELLAHHAQHQSESAQVAQREADAQRKVEEAEVARQHALEAAARARSEAERLVAEELARLLDLEKQLVLIEQRFDAAPGEIAARRDAVLGWQRRAREALGGDKPPPDSLYDALRVALRAARSELSSALDSLAATGTEIPVVPRDPLPDLKRLANIEVAEQKRSEVSARALRLHDREQRLRESRAAALLEEIDTLNRERLNLLDSLSTEKRAAVTGFSATGLDQAQAEVRHLLLVLRYHRYATSRWLASMRRPGAAIGSTIVRVVGVLVPWTLLLGLFLFWQRRGPALLSGIERSLETGDRAARLSAPSPALRLFRFLTALQRPLAWLALFLGMVWLLPDQASELLEVQLVKVSVGWILASVLIINTVNAALASSDGARKEAGQPALRLRSLQLIGHVVVAFALVLILSARLVGQGTIYMWVFATCWIAALPTLLVLVRWWRGTVFARIERIRKPSRFQRWALGQRTGVLSLVAVLAVAVHLLAGALLRMTRGWVTTFGLVRRIHAYLFRRELDKRTDVPSDPLRPLPPEAWLALDPDTGNSPAIEADFEETRADLLQRVAERRGGLFALVGARGMGKTTCLHTLHADVSGSALLTLHAGHEAPDVLAAQIESAAAAPLVLIDGAHERIVTAIGGLAAWDQLFAAAQRHSEKTVFVFTVDAAIWPFLRMARGNKPLFDDVFTLRPWTEEKIVQLLESRVAAAGLHTTFEDLVDELPAGADEIERQDAIHARKTGYFRMVWDYANGNPGIALHLFRDALELDPAGCAHVRRFQAPSLTELDRLPDAALFTLRALLQCPATAADDIAQATGLRTAEIADVLRYSLARGYLEQHQGRHRITWTWLVAIMQLLERRHLLVST